MNNDRLEEYASELHKNEELISFDVVGGYSHVHLHLIILIFGLALLRWEKLLVPGSAFWMGPVVFAFYKVHENLRDVDEVLFRLSQADSHRRPADSTEE